MIKSLELQNYKAFDAVTIPLKPITILLGANNAGKSSIIQMIMLLRQTAEEIGYNYSSALKIYGDYVNIGEFQNLYKNRSYINPLKINLVVESQDLMKDITNRKRDYIFSIIMALIDSRASIQSVFNSIDSPTTTSSAEFNKLIRFIIKSYKQLNDSNEFEKKMVLKRLNDLGISETEISKKNHSHIYKVFGLLTKLQQIKGNALSIGYELTFNKKLYISRLIIKTIDGETLMDIYESKDSFSIKSDFVTLSANEKTVINNYFHKERILFDCIENNLDGIDSPSVFLILQIAKGIITKLGGEFSERMITYVSPLRAHPKRYYMLDKAKHNLSLNTLDGDAIAEVLNDNNDVKTNVNKWLSKFKLEIDVRKFKEVIHNLKVKTLTGFELDITDVGFGISQVLPIIIQGFLSQTNSTTIIEQPEIHLHPKMQADLGDLFIDIIKNNKKKLIIETHSEYMLKRIRRRISEGEISADMVSICLFHPKTEEKDAWVEHLEIEEKGNFEWPEEYYGGELLKDTTLFLKNQL